MSPPVTAERTQVWAFSPGSDECVCYTELLCSGESLCQRRVVQKDSKDDDFENILAGLETDIREHEEALAFIVQRERRAVLLLTIYSVLAWLVYVLAWYFGALDAWNGDLELQNEGSQILERAFKTLPVGAIPVLYISNMKSEQGHG